jgi:signal transduction histidine kinase
VDYGAAVFCAVFIFAVLFHSTDGARIQVGLLAPRGALLALLAIGLSFPVAIRRRLPVRALVIVLAGCVATLAVGGELTRGPFLPLAAVLYVVASTCRRTVALAGLAAALIVLIAQGVVLHFEGLGSGNATGAALALTIAWMIGYLVQQRRTHLAHVRDRVASDAVTAERLRIARELHDVVAHSMTVVSVQAGFGEYVFDSQPGEARAALGAIQAVSREALGEMQRMLCVLRQPDAEIAADTAPAGPAIGAVPAVRLRTDTVRAPAPLAPAPGLGNLDRLVQRTAGAGVTVTVERIGAPRDLPAGLDLSAYRIVQEALTNVVKHSGADRCHVVLEYGVDSLLIEVTDPGRSAPSEIRVPSEVRVPSGVGVPAAAGVASGSGLAAGSGEPDLASTGDRPPSRAAGVSSGPDRAGHGIIGMRERVSLCGGQLFALARPGGGFVVRARLPLPAGRS